MTTVKASGQLTLRDQLRSRNRQLAIRNWASIGLGDIRAFDNHRVLLKWGQRVEGVY